MILRVAVALLLLFSVLVGGAQAIGAARPNPKQSVAALLLTTPDGNICPQPCLLGIRPGLTTFEQAIALVQRHPAISTVDTRSSLINYWVMVIVGNRMTVTLNDASATLLSPNIASNGLLTLINPTPPLLLRDVIAVLGAPEAVYLDFHNKYSTFWLIYKGSQIIVEVTEMHAMHDDERLRMEAPVVALRLSGRGLLVSGQKVRWRGFTRVGLFRSEPIG